MDRDLTGALYDLLLAATELLLSMLLLLRLQGGFEEKLPGYS